MKKFIGSYFVLICIAATALCGCSSEMFDIGPGGLAERDAEFLTEMVPVVKVMAGSSLSTAVWLLPVSGTISQIGDTGQTC